MLRSNENKKWFGMIAVIILCLPVVGAGQAEWLEQAKLLASDGAAYDMFGTSSINGNYAIVGASQYLTAGGTGWAYIFKLDGTSWIEQVKLTASDAAGGDRFGEAVSICGNYAIVGARGDRDNGPWSGSAYMFKRDGTTWAEQAKLLASDGAAYDTFGASVSISGDHAIVAADQSVSGKAGSAYIFKRDGESWAEQAKLTASDGAARDHFGVCVSISGDYAIVGARMDDDKGENSGSAYIFNRDGDTWNQQAKLSASDGAARDQFGGSVSIDGDYAIVGAHNDDDKGENSGSAYMFKRDGTTWAEQAKLTASDGEAHDGFCVASISGDYVVVGAPQEQNGGPGSAYIFKRNGTGWTEQAKLVASDGTPGVPGDCFGIRVSISGDYTIVAAILDDDNGTDAGSAYIFVRRPILVEIDIKPGSYPNAINLGSRGLIPVAILSSDDFDATNVDPDTVELAGAGVDVRGKSNKYMAHEEDVNGDGLVDLVVQVATENLNPDSFQNGYAVLTGSTYDGQEIEGSDEITIVPQ